jgi:hypothetical protein
MNRVLENLGAHPQDDEGVAVRDPLNETTDTEASETNTQEQNEEPQEEINADPTTRDLLDAVERNERTLQELLDFQSAKEKRRASRKAYDEEWKKHFWASSFVTFFFGVSVGILTSAIVDLLRK